LAISFRVNNAQYSEILNYRTSLCMLSIIRLFFIFGILVYSQKLVCMQYIGNSTTNSSSRTTSCHAELYIILWISILWIFRHFISFASQSERSNIDYLTKSSHFILFRMGQSSEVLAIFFYQQILYQYYYGTVRGYIQQEVQKCLSLEFTVQSTCENCPQLFKTCLV